jgi:hypothetical protein
VPATYVQKLSDKQSQVRPPPSSGLARTPRL